MDKLLEVPNIKNELNNSTSSDRLDFSSEIQAESVKQENNSSVQSEVHIKIEPFEDEFTVVANTSYDSCLNDVIKSEINEPMIRIESVDTINDNIQDPLDVDKQIKVEFEDNSKADETEDEEKFNSISNEQPESLENGTSKTKNNLPGKKKPGRRIKKHPCHVCHKIFVLKSGLDMHLRIHTGEKPYECHICKKTFSVKSSLERHMLIHSDEKSYECDICKKVFRHQDTLNKHKVTHSDERQFTCTVCNKSFKHKHYFVKHQVLHTGHKPYVCDVCNKAFALRPNFVRHKRVHTGEKPYSCEICKKSFAHKVNLTQHTRSHTGERPFSCDLCDKSFAWKENLNYHIKTHKK